MNVPFNYFNYSEFDSPDLKGSGEKFMDRNFISKLDEARAIADTSFVINSGYRTKSYNKKVGGVKNSSHRKGVAVDIKATDSRKRFKIVSSLLAVGINRIGIGKNYVHADMDRSKPPNVVWHYYG